jgi:hypothetical protein
MMQAYKLVTACLTAAFLAACGAANEGVSSPAPQLGGAPAGRNANHFVPRYITVKPQGINYATLGAQANAGETLPFYTGEVKSPLDGNTYRYKIVGKNPAVAPAEETVIPFVPIVLVMKFPDATLDPTQPGCNDDKSVADRFFKGPDFEKTPLSSNGVDLGNDELDDAFQRAEFWQILAGPEYHLVLKPAVSPIVVTKDAPPGSYTFAGVCAGSSHAEGIVNWQRYDEMIKDLAEQYASPTQVPLVLTYNVVAGGSVLGWHSAFARKDGRGTQVYAVAVYNDRDLFYEYPGVADIHAWTHEIGELSNDPFVDNATPPWGHTGQVFGCQADFEVGDPLTFDSFELTYNGFHYHPQELAFFSWFYRTPSTGTGGQYSFKGTFYDSQGTCH